MQGSISMAAARLDDAKAVDRLVQPIPNNQPLREALQVGFAGSIDIYHAATKTARYIHADGKLVVCFVLTDVTQQEALGVRDELAKLKSADLNLASFKTVVARTLQVQISGIH